MNQNQWREKIVDACERVGTYKPSFDSIIDTLAKIMEARDEAQEQYESTGSHPTIVHTNKAKEKNVVKNPMLAMVIDLNAQALAYWRDLGLTPAGLKKINETSLKEKEEASALERALMNLE